MGGLDLFSCASPGFTSIPDKGLGEKRDRQALEMADSLSVSVVSDVINSMGCVDFPNRCSRWGLTVRR